MKSFPIFVALIMPLLPLSGMGGEPYVSRVLDNGLEVIVLENHTVPLATVGIILKGGAYTESPEENGLSNLYENLFFKPSQFIADREAYDERVRELGMVVGSSTREEWIHFHITLSRDSLEAGLEFMWQAMEYPLFDQDELTLEQQVILEELDRESANPEYVLARAVRQKLWGQRVSRKDFLGDPGVIRAATMEQMRLLHDRYGLPNNAALMVAGDVQPRDVFRLVREQFGSWRAGPDPFKASPVPPMIPLETSEDTVVIQAVNSARITLAWHGPSVTGDVKGTFAADVLSLILRQKTSVFQKNLVDAGMALEASLFYYTQKVVGPIFMNVVCRPDKLKEAHAALLAEVDRLADPDYFTDEQLANAKTLLKVDAIYKGDKALEFIHEVGFWWAVAGPDYYRDYLDNLRAVSREDITNYVNRYLRGQPHVSAVMLDRSSQQAFEVVEGSLLP